MAFSDNQNNWKHLKSTNFIQKIVFENGPIFGRFFTLCECVNDQVEDCEECHENFLLTRAVSNTTLGTKTCTECSVGSTLEGNMCLGHVPWSRHPLLF